VSASAKGQEPVKPSSARFWSSVLLLSALLFGAGCDKPQGVSIGDAAPAISGNDVHGEYVSLGQLKGKVVVIYFWVNSCCGASLKQLEPFYRQRRGDGLEILAINEFDSGKDLQAYAAGNSLSFTLLTDEHSMLSKQYRAFGFPTVFIVDRNGIVREKILGALRIADLEKRISLQLDRKPFPK
jgi:peroxiredoxin